MKYCFPSCWLCLLGILQQTSYSRLEEPARGLVVENLTKDLGLSIQDAHTQKLQIYAEKE
jgi:hypothetical protein